MLLFKLSLNCPIIGQIDNIGMPRPAGKITMEVIATVAEFERDLLIERTQTGISVLSWPVNLRQLGKQL